MKVSPVKAAKVKTHLSPGPLPASLPPTPYITGRGLRRCSRPSGCIGYLTKPGQMETHTRQLSTHSSLLLSSVRTRPPAFTVTSFLRGHHKTWGTCHGLMETTSSLSGCSSLLRIPHGLTHPGEWAGLVQPHWRPWVVWGPRLTLLG